MCQPPIVLTVPKNRRFCGARRKSRQPLAIALIISPSVTVSTKSGGTSLVAVQSESTMRRPLPPLNERPRNGARRHKLRELLSLGRSMGPKLNGGALILRPGESQDPGRRVGIAGFWDPALAETAVVIKTRNISAPSEVWPPARKPAFLHLRSLCKSQGRPRSSAWRCCAPCSVCRCRRACSRPGQDAFPP